MRGESLCKGVTNSRDFPQPKQTDSVSRREECEDAEAKKVGTHFRPMRKVVKESWQFALFVYPGTPLIELCLSLFLTVPLRTS